MRVRITRNLFIILTMDLILVCAAFYLSHLIRFDFDVPDWALRFFWQILPVLVGIKLACFYFFDLYRGMWRYTGLNDLINMVKASLTASFIIIVMILYINRFQMVSRSVFLIDWSLTLILIISLRLFTRICFEQFTETIGLEDIKHAFLGIFTGGRHRGTGVIIIGAGDCGEKICREFKENPALTSHVKGFLDDDRAKIGRKIHGIPVLDRIDHLDEVVRGTGAREVIIAIPTAVAARMREIVSLCKQADVRFKTVPSIGELIDGKVTISSIREVEYRDLLGREPVVLEKERIGRYLGGKTVLVTGAGGSIGTGLCRQICRYHPKTLVLFERAESPLYEIDLELKDAFPDVEIVPLLGDIQQRRELMTVFQAEKPDIVFHAAAYKHVPMLERHPWKAVENNVQGTRNLVEAADRYQCDRFVFVSTDKAVNPFNVMGASKRISEMIVQGMNLKEASATRFLTVRFGNVIGSVGSVIPLFKKQIKDGGPVTVTHPDMIRYFMLIPEACQLILQAGAMGQGGEIFILEMGEPVNIDSMARDLIRFSGFEPDRDIRIEYTGLRPGEKMYEELMTDTEDVVPTGHDKILVLKNRKLDMAGLDNHLVQLKTAAEKRDGGGIRRMLKEIVPEYEPNPWY